jgi:hypothetical protein
VLGARAHFGIVFRVLSNSTAAPEVLLARWPLSHRLFCLGPQLYEHWITKRVLCDKMPGFPGQPMRRAEVERKFRSNVGSRKPHLVARNYDQSELFGSTQTDEGGTR